MNNKDWEKEFDEKFGSVELDNGAHPLYVKRLKDFIRSTLHSQKEEIKETIQDSIKEEDFELSSDMEFGRGRVIDYRMGWNDAMKTILSLLSEHKE